LAGYDPGGWGVTDVGSSTSPGHGTFVFGLGGAGGNGRDLPSKPAFRQSVLRACRRITEVPSGARAVVGGCGNELGAHLRPLFHTAKDPRLVSWHFSKQKTIARDRPEGARRFCTVLPSKGSKEPGRRGRPGDQGKPASIHPGRPGAPGRTTAFIRRPCGAVLPAVPAGRVSTPVSRSRGRGHGGWGLNLREPHRESGAPLARTGFSRPLPRGGSNGGRYSGGLRSFPLVNHVSLHRTARPGGSSNEVGEGWKCYFGCLPKGCGGEVLDARHHPAVATIATGGGCPGGSTGFRARGGRPGSWRWTRGRTANHPPCRNLKGRGCGASGRRTGPG